MLVEVTPEVVGDLGVLGGFETTVEKNRFQKPPDETYPDVTRFQKPPEDTYTLVTFFQTPLVDT
jgi:hypothetical protein